MHGNVNRRQAVVCLPVAALLSLPARADLYDDYINSTSKQPFVIFLARKGVPGHAFVGIGVQLEASLIVYERFFGYYPVGSNKLSEAKLVFSKTTGALDYKWKDATWDVKYRKDFDDVKRQAALGVADTWQGNDPKYNLFALGGKNCSVFAGEVAKAIGLKVPSGAGSMLQADFIAKLRETNGGK